MKKRLRTCGKGDIVKCRWVTVTFCGVVLAGSCGIGEGERPVLLMPAFSGGTGLRSKQNTQNYVRQALAIFSYVIKQLTFRSRAECELSTSIASSHDVLQSGWEAALVML